MTLPLSTSIFSLCDRFRYASLLFVMLFALGNSACAASSNKEAVPEVVFKQATILVANKSLTVEFADVWALRSRGLMYRESLCADCGMLFEFKPRRQVSMWMKNTYIPLDVAYFKSDGTITDIKPLQPQDLTSVGSSDHISYALEMNQGWFAKHNVAVGDKIQVLDTSAK